MPCRQLLLCNHWTNKVWNKVIYVGIPELERKKSFHTFDALAKRVMAALPFGEARNCVSL